MSHLIVVDVQNERQTPGSDYNLGDFSSLIENINKLIDHCRSQGFNIIFIKHIEKGSEDAFAENTKRTELVNGLHTETDDIIIKKYKISPFYNTNLETIIEGSEQIVVCGILTNLCVRSLINDLYDRDYNTTLIEDCCISTDQQTHDFTLEDIKNTRPEVNIKKLEEYRRSV